MNEDTGAKGRERGGPSRPVADADREGTATTIIAGDPTVEMAIGPVIRLPSGGRIDLLDPRNGRFGIPDVAYGLALACMYPGQGRRFYSVAEHSLLVSEVCTEEPLAALMHAAADAFLGHVPPPLRALLPGFRRIRRDVAEAISERFGLPTTPPECVRRAEVAVIAAEQARIAPPGVGDWAAAAGVIPAPVEVRHMPPGNARHEFLTRYEALHPAHRSPFGRRLTERWSDPF